MTADELRAMYPKLCELASAKLAMPAGVEMIRRGSNSSCWWMRVRAGGRLWHLKEYKKSVGRVHVERLGAE